MKHALYFAFGFLLFSEFSPAEAYVKPPCQAELHKLMEIYDIGEPDENNQITPIQAEKEKWVYGSKIQFEKDSEEKAYQNFPGLPRVIARICEFCGVNALKCVHGAERKKRALTAPEAARERLEIDPVNGAKIHITEPLDKTVSEEPMTEEQKQQLASRKIAANVQAQQPTPSDEEVSGKLDEVMADETASIGNEKGEEDVDV